MFNVKARTTAENLTSTDLLSVSDMEVDQYGCFFSKENSQYRVPGNQCRGKPSQIKSNVLNNFSSMTGKVEADLHGNSGDGEI